MAAVTPSTALKLSLGNRVGVIATFGAIDDTNTWTTGLGNVEAVFVTPDAYGATVGASYSGGIVTFSLSGSLRAAMVLAIGFG